jgi:serine/threonine-protein kinase
VTDQEVVKKIGKYEIIVELGWGMMGVVYKARDSFSGRLVAFKTVKVGPACEPDSLQCFCRESQLAATLLHPNIALIYDLGEFDGGPYIVTEYVEGESLEGIIRRRAGIPLAAKLKLVQQICEGLAHAHRHGVVHGNIKPANILVTNEGAVKLVDFGMVQFKPGVFLAVPCYVSPERMTAGRTDSRSDVWSVTCVIYELIAYKKAFDVVNLSSLVAKILSSEPEPLSRCCPGVPANLDTVISKGLKKNVEERYQSVDEMLADLISIARRIQQSFIGDLLQEAKDLRDKGDLRGAQERLRAVLILDDTHEEGNRLQTEIAAELRRRTPRG